MKETEMGNRGSKSDFIIKSVKEQRVDGSWFINYTQLINLRCTLMGFERTYPVKIHSNKIQINKNFSTLTSKKNSNFLPITLDPWYITGLIVGEGSFMVRVRKNSKYKTGWSISPVFSISIHKAELPLLKAVKAYFGDIGSISKSQGNV
jgi:LAGLIDADG endonuclease